MIPCNNIFDLISFLFERISNTLFLKVSIDLTFAILKILNSVSNINSFILKALYNIINIIIQPIIINDVIFFKNKILKKETNENQEQKLHPK